MVKSNNVRLLDPLSRGALLRGETYDIVRRYALMHPSHPVKFEDEEGEMMCDLEPVFKKRSVSPVLAVLEDI